MLYYSVPINRPTVGPNVFGDRWWDVADGWVPEGPGIVPGTEAYYSGPIPAGPLTELGGTPEEWVEGIDYDTWISGGYTLPGGCFPVDNLRRAEIAVGLSAYAPIPTDADVAVALDWVATGYPAPIPTDADVAVALDWVATGYPAPIPTDADVSVVLDWVATGEPVPTVPGAAVSVVLDWVATTDPPPTVPGAAVSVVLDWVATGEPF